MKRVNFEQKHFAILLAIVSCVAALYFYLNVDMSGMPYSEIVKYREAHPNKNVTYTVTINGDTPLKLNDRSTAVTANLTHAEDLISRQEYLQNLTEITFQEETLSADMVHALKKAYPHAVLSCDKISFAGKSFAYDATVIDLSDLTAEQIEEAANGMKAMPVLEAVELCQGDALSSLTLEDAHRLYTLYPDAQYHYRINLFGQVLTTDMERVEYFKEKIKDEGLEQFKLLLPMMHKLTYFKLDWCGTSDEAMDELRTQYKDKFKVVWRIFFGGDYNALTDTYKLWANGDFSDSSMKAVKYCNEVRYLDFGHSKISSCEWARYMPELEVCILSDSYLRSIEPLTECKKLTYLEFFITWVKDLSPLEQMPQLQYLNFSQNLAGVWDISPLYNLNNLIHVNAVLNYNFSQEQIDTFKQLHPECESYFLPYGEPTRHNWRYDIKGHKLPRYALLREQIGYDGWDYSRYPGGYLTEEVTYESTGITPPEAYVALMERLEKEGQKPA